MSAFSGPAAWMTPMRHLPSAVLLALLAAGLAGCGGEEATPEDSTQPVPLSGRVETADGTASFELPGEGWVKAAWELDGPVTFAAVLATDETQQLFVSRAGSVEEAEDGAVTAAAALAQQGATCTRDREDRTFGATYRIVDCVFEDSATEQPYRKIGIALGDEARGAWLLVAGTGAERADLAPFVTPLLASWRWEK